MASPRSDRLFAVPRAALLRRTLVAALLSEMALCPRLWTADRPFPAVPAWEGVPRLPQAATLALVALFVGSLLASAVLPRPRPALLAASALGSALALFDIDRLQPWFYQALLLFLALGLSSKKPRDEAWAACAFVLAATYFWSGLQKANLLFAGRVFPWLLQPLGLDALRPFWFVVPAGETAVGLLLLFPRTRAWGLVGAFALHAFLLLALGPLGHGFNSVVWPWNVGMPLLAFLAFFRNPDPVFPALGRSAVAKGIVLFAGVLPALNFVGRWDDYLSDALYSGRSRQAFVFFTEEGARQVPPDARSFLQRRPDRIGLDLDRWSLAVLNVPVYPEVRVYQGLAQGFRAAGVPERDMTLVVTGHPSRRAFSF